MLHGHLKLWNNSLYKMGLLLQNYPKMTFSLCSHGYCVIGKEFSPVHRCELLMVCIKLIFILVTF